MNKIRFFISFIFFVSILVLPRLSFANLSASVSGDNQSMNNELESFMNDKLLSSFNLFSGFYRFEKVYQMVLNMNSMNSPSNDLIGATRLSIFSVGFAPSFFLNYVTEKINPDSSFPAFTIGGGFHLGLNGGIFSEVVKQFDFIIKGMYLPIKFYGIDFSLFSFGFKTRWNFLKERSLLSVISWGGLTSSVSLDYSFMKMDFPFSNFIDDDKKEFTIPGFGNNSGKLVKLNSGIIGFKSSTFSITTDIMTNISFFRFFTFFASTGLLLNVYRGQSLGFILDGVIVNNPIKISVSSDKKPNIAIPFFKGGLEINIFYVNFIIQGSISYASQWIGGGSAGLRIRF